MSTIGENIRVLREQLGYTQHELAKKTGYKDRTSIAKIESGKINLTQSKIELFAHALNTAPVKLIGWDDSSKVYQDDTLESYLNKIGIPCEYKMLRIHGEDYQYYSITLFGEECCISTDNYKLLNEDILSLVLEYAKSNNNHVNTLITNYMQLSDVGKTKILDNIKDLAKLYSK